MEMSPQIDIEDDYDHPDDSIEYIIECIPCTPAASEDVDNEFNKLQELYSTLLMNSCFCPHASACGSTLSPFASNSCAHAGNYRTYTHIDETTEFVLNRSRPSRDVIFECSSLCTCHAGVCQNRLVQYGPRKHLEIVDSHYLNGQRGLITTKFIPRGGFICEYAGELLTRSEAKRRELLSGITENSVGIDGDDSNVDESIDDDLFVYQRKDDESNDDETNGNDNSNDNESNDNESIDNESNGIQSNELKESDSNENGNEDAEVAAAFIQDADDNHGDEYEDIEDEIDEDKTISSSSMDFERSYNKSKMNYVMCLNEYSFESLRHLTGNKSNSMPLEVDESYDENSVLQPIQTIIDPSLKGNIGRYLNHSCEPNCEIISVRIDCPIPKVAFFAKRNIQPFEELTFHYAGGAKASAELSGYKNLSLCFCGAKTCQLYLPNLAY